MPGGLENGHPGGGREQRAGDCRRDSSLELVIGPQPKLPEVEPRQARNRFNYAFQQFLSVVCRPEHPLVLFLDDLQWADVASLELLKAILTQPGRGSLLVIGAYRDNELTPTHSLALAIEELRQAHVCLRSIVLASLEAGHVSALVADSLHSQAAVVQPLADLIMAKTQGNAFFVHEFLKALYDEGLLVFDEQRRQWVWNVGCHSGPADHPTTWWT